MSEAAAVQAPIAPYAPSAPIEQAKAAAARAMPFIPRAINYQASGGEMLLYVFFLAGASAILFIATALIPSGTGLGTHQQMGFPPCSMIQWFDTPCAFCGMTTCFTLCAGGHWVQAFLAQPFGVVMYLFTVAMIPVCGYGLVRRFSWMEWIPERVILGGTSAVLVMMVLGWVYKIVVYKNHWL